jgi:hypothetical protein
MTKRHPLLALRQAQYRLKEGKEGRAKQPRDTPLFLPLLGQDTPLTLPLIGEMRVGKEKTKNPLCLGAFVVNVPGFPITRE